MNIIRCPTSSTSLCYHKGSFIQIIFPTFQSIYKLTQRLHTTTAEAASLQRVFQFAGVDIHTVIPLFARLDKQIGSTGTAGNATAQAMQRFGVALTDQSGALLPLNQQLGQLAAGYKKAQENGQAEAFTAEILGARGAALIPILEQYQDLMEINARVKTTGLLDPEEAHRVYIEWSAMKIEASQLGNAVGAALLPVAEEMMPEITTVIRKTVTTQRIVLCRCRLAASGSVFATKTVSF
mgnify:CR=1 FL=1